MSGFLPYDRMGGSAARGGSRPEGGRPKKPLLSRAELGPERTAVAPALPPPRPGPSSSPERPAPPAPPAVPPAAPPPLLHEDRPNYSKFLIWLKSHVLHGLAAFAIVGGAVFGISIQMAPPVYRSETTIKFNFKGDALLEKIATHTGLAPSDRVEEEMEVIKSDGVLGRVLQEIDDPDLRVDQNIPPHVVAGRIQGLRGKISFEHGNWINVVVILVSDQDPERARKILSGLCRSYIAYDTERKRENDRKQYSFLAQELERLEVRMQGLEEVSDEMKEIERLEGERAKIDLRLRELDESIDKIRTELSLKREQLVRDFTSKYPQVVEIEETLARIEEIRNETRVAELGKFREKTLEQVALVRFEMLVATERQRQHSERVRGIEDGLRERGFPDPSPVVVREQLEAQQETFQLFDRTKSSLQLGLARSEYNEKIELLREEPTLPSAPVVNQLRSNILLSVFLGALAAAVLLWGLYDTNPSLFDAHEIEAALGLPILATIPRDQARTSPRGEGKPREFVAEGPDVIADYFEILATSLRSSSARDPVRLLVTSADAQEGKSTISLNLAIAFSRLGQETVLVECNLRRPSLHRAIELPEHPRGIIDCARDDRLRLRDFLRPTSYERLSMITAGEVGGGSTLATQYLRSSRFLETLEEFRREGRVVVIDSSPVLLVSDPQVLSGLVDGVVLVFNAGRTALRRVERSLAILKRAGANVLGLVANSKFVDSATSYRRSYRREAQARETAK